MTKVEYLDRSSYLLEDLRDQCCYHCGIDDPKADCKGCAYEDVNEVVTFLRGLSRDERSSLRAGD
jgi:hypothetical protein